MKLSKSFEIVCKRNIQITKILKVPNYKTLEKKFSRILDIPAKVIFFENCQILSNDWNFQKKKIYPVCVNKKFS